MRGWRSTPTPMTVETTAAPASPVTSPGSAPRQSDRPEPAVPTGQPGTQVSPRATPVVVSVSISPILVRGADEPAHLAIEPGTDTVRLLLKGEKGERRLTRGRAIVRTVAGREVWRGPAVAAASPGQEFARVEIPAALFHPDDYIVQLFGSDARGGEAERYQYFLRVRPK